MPHANCPICGEKISLDGKTSCVHADLIGLLVGFVTWCKRNGKEVDDINAIVDFARDTYKDTTKDIASPENPKPVKP